MTRPYQGLSSLAPGVKMRDPGNEVAVSAHLNKMAEAVADFDAYIDVRFHLRLVFTSDEVGVERALIT